MKFTANIKSWYVRQFPDDDYAKEQLKADTTFKGLYDTLVRQEHVYNYLFRNGHSDSIIREQLFSKLAVMLKVDDEIIYDMWNTKF